MGIYSVCTFRLADVTGLPFLAVIPRYFAYVALGAWLAVFIGPVRRLVGGLAPASRVPSS